MSGPDDDRAAQISARLVVRAGWHQEMVRNAPADLAWLLAERAALLARVEAAEAVARAVESAKAAPECTVEIAGVRIEACDAHGVTNSDEINLLKAVERRADDTDDLDRRVEAAERAGAVKALRGASEDWPMLGNLAVKEWLSVHADDIENGAPL